MTPASRQTWQLATPATLTPLPDETDQRGFPLSTGQVLAFLVVFGLGILVPALRIPLFAVLGAGFLIVAFSNFLLAMMGTLLVIPFLSILPKSLLIPGLNPETLLFLTLTAAYLGGAGGLKPKHVEGTAEGKLIGIFSVVVVLSVFIGWLLHGEVKYVSKTIGQNFAEAKSWLIYLSLYFFAKGSMRRSDSARALFLVFLAVFAIIGVQGIREYLSGGGRRIGGFIAEQANEFGGILALNLMFVIPFIASKERLAYRLLAMFVLGTCGFCLMFTLSRSSMLAFVAGLAFTGLVISRKVLAVGVFLALVLYFVVPQAVVDRFAETKNAEETASWLTEGKSFADAYDLGVEVDNSTAFRLIQWRAFPRMVVDQPVLGHGFNTYSIVLYETDSWLWYRPAHSAWLRIGVEQGLVGLALVMALLALCFRQGFEAYRQGPTPFIRNLATGYMAGLIVVFVVNMAGIRFYSGAGMTYFWAFGGVLKGVMLEAKRGSGRGRGEDDESASD